MTLYWKLYWGLIQFLVGKRTVIMNVKIYDDGNTEPMNGWEIGVLFSNVHFISTPEPDEPPSGWQKFTLQ